MSSEEAALAGIERIVQPLKDGHSVMSFSLLETITPSSRRRVLPIRHE